jgi:hypothetical protein
MWKTLHLITLGALIVDRGFKTHDAFKSQRTFANSPGGINRKPELPRLIKGQHAGCRIGERFPRLKT